MVRCRSSFHVPSIINKLVIPVAIKLISHSLTRADNSAMEGADPENFDVSRLPREEALEHKAYPSTFFRAGYALKYYHSNYELKQQ